MPCLEWHMLFREFFPCLSELYLLFPNHFSLSLLKKCHHFLSPVACTPYSCLQNHSAHLSITTNTSFAILAFIVKLTCFCNLGLLLPQQNPANLSDFTQQWNLVCLSQPSEGRLCLSNRHLRLHCDVHKSASFLALGTSLSEASYDSTFPSLWSPQLMQHLLYGDLTNFTAE